jgi:hypothetical protein
MREHVTHGCALFAVGPELRPHLHHGRVVIEEPALDEHVRHGGRRTLAHGVGVERRVRCNRTPGLGVGEARDRVYNLLTVTVDGDLQTSLGSRLDQFVDSILDLLLEFSH